MRFEHLVVAIWLGELASLSLVSYVAMCVLKALETVSRLMRHDPLNDGLSRGKSD